MTAPVAVSLGIDLGTSALKGVLLDRDANVVASARSPYPTSRPQPGMAEQRPRDWIRALERVCASLGRRVDPSAWRGIGLSGMIPSLVLVDREGEPLGRALTWEDGRAEPQARALRRAVGARELYATTGQWVDSHYLLPMWRWIADHEADRARSSAFVLCAKDFVLWWLTGEIATDPSTATGFGCFDLTTGRWDRDIADAVGLGRTPKLPRIVPSTGTFPIRRDAAERLGVGASTAVTVGAADSVLSADALGGLPDGEIAYIAGTSTVMMSFHDSVELDARHRYLVTPSTRPGRWGYEMDLLSTGSALRWCASLLGLGPRGESALLELAERSRPVDDLVFLPYLAPGEQGALWDPSLRGVVDGLTLSDGPAEVARALVEGIVLESRRCVGVLRSKGAAPLIRATDWGARGPWFRGLLADATGVDVVAHGTRASAAAAGAAALADPATSERLSARATSAGTFTHADPSAAAEWERRWARHEEARRRAI